MPPLVAWPSENRLLYELVCALSVFMMLSVCLFALLREKALKENYRALNILTHPLTFIAALGFCIAFHRLPFLYISGHLNMDEAQALASAIKFQTDWVPWRSVDNGTVGPFMSWLLNVFSFAGLPLNYSTARLAGITCLITQWSLTYLSIRMITTESLSRILTCTGVMFSAYSLHPDFVHYSSEHLPNAVLAGTWFFGVRWIVRKKFRYALVGVFLLGWLPWIKIQYTPFVILFILAASIRILMMNPRGFVKSAAGLIAAVAVPTGIMSVILLTTGSFSDFFRSYILANLAYSSACPNEIYVPLLAFWPAMFVGTKAFSYPLFALTLTGVTALIVRPQLISSRVKMFFIWFLTGMMASALALSASGRAFWHYFLIVVLVQTISTGLFCGAIIQELLNSTPARLRLLTETLCCVLLCALLIWPQSLVKDHGQTPPGWWDDAIRQSMQSRQVEAGLMEKYGRRPIAVWGYRPDIFLLLAAVPATRDMSTFIAIVPGRLCAYYQNRFLSDLKNSRPPLFIDATTLSASGPTDRKTQKREMFEELKIYVAEHYILEEELVMPGGPEKVLIYRQKSLQSPSLN